MIKNGLYNVLGAVARIALTIITLPLLIRTLGLEEYGIWTIAYTVVGLITLIDTGLAVSTTVFVSQDLTHDQGERIGETLTVVVSAAVVLGLILTVAFFLSASFIALLFPILTASQKDVVTIALRLSAFTIMPRLLQQVFVGMEQAYQRYDLSNALNVLQVFLTNGGMLGVAVLGGRTVGLMRWQIAAAVIILAFHVVAVLRLRRGAPLHIRWSKERGSEILRYTLSAWAALFGSTLFNQVDRLIVGALLGPRVVAVYAAITNLTVQINLLSALPVQPLLPIVSRDSARTTAYRQTLVAQLRQAVEINSLAAFGIAAAMVALAPFILQLVAPDLATNSNVLAFRLASIIYGLYSINAVGYFVLLGLQEVRLCMVNIALSGVVALAGIAVGCYAYGLLGAILGNAGYILTIGLNTLAMRRMQLLRWGWLIWIAVPISWFVGACVAGLLLPDAIALKIALAVVQSGLIVAWFIRAQRTELRLMVSRFTLRRN